MKHLFAILTIPCSLLLSACCVFTGVHQYEEIILEGRYQLTQLGHHNHLPNEHPVELTLNPDRISGNGPINSWSATLSKYHQIGPITSTKLAGPPQAMQLESALFEALEGGTLSLQGGSFLVLRDDEVIAEFKHID